MIDWIKGRFSNPKQILFTVITVVVLSITIRMTAVVLQQMTRYNLPCTEIADTTTVRIPISNAPVGCVITLNNDPIPIIYFDQCDRVISRCR